MKLSEFKTFIRLVVPSANVNRVSDVQMNLLINKGVRNANRLARVLTKEGYFNAEAGKSEYILTTALPDFTMIGKSGLWYNKGTESSPYYVELDAINREYLNKIQPNWKQNASGNPLYSIIEVNKAFIHPAPASDLTNGFWLPDYIHAPVSMTNDDQYPFYGDTTERPYLEVLDDAIINYVRWTLALAVGEKQEGIINYDTYFKTVQLAKIQLKARPDYPGNRDFRMKTRVAGR